MYAKLYAIHKNKEEKFISLPGCSSLLCSSTETLFWLVSIFKIRMKYSWSTAVLVAAFIGLAYTIPHGSRSRKDVSPWNPQSPYFVQRYGRLGRVGPLYDEEFDLERGRKYKIVSKKSKNKKPAVVEDDPEDEEEEQEDIQDDVEESEETNNDADGGGSFDIPPWETLFPVKNEDEAAHTGGAPPQGGYSSGPSQGGYSSGPPSQGGQYGGGGPPGGGSYRGSLPQRGHWIPARTQKLRRLPVQNDYYQPNHYERRYRSDVSGYDEDDLEEFSAPPPTRRNYPVYRSRDGRSGVRVITGWSDTPLHDTYNPEYIVNPTLMRLRRKHRYHPSQEIPRQKIPLRGHYGNPRDTYINPYGGQRWSGGPYGPYVYDY